MHSRYTLKDVRFLLENENRVKSEVNKDLKTIVKNIDIDICIRDVFHILEYILYFKNEKYIETILLPIIHRINGTQIRRENVFKVFFGKYSPITEYNYIEAKKDYLLGNIGAFPTRISRGKVYVDGLYPDIDSTAYSLIILSKVYKILKDRVKEGFVKTLERGIDYLLRRDINKDGLLEQAMNEDWALGACREGSIAYSNIIFYLAIEHLYDTFLSVGDREYINKLERKLTETADAILDKLWVHDYLVNGIDRFGKYDLTYSLDTIYITQSLILTKDEKVKVHMKTLADKLTVNGLLIVFYPPSSNSCLEKYEEFTDLNASVWPKYNIIFARALIGNGYITEAAKLLKNIFEIKNYQWINPYKPSVHGPYSIENNILFLITLEEMKKKLEESDEEGPASTDQE